MPAHGAYDLLIADLCEELAAQERASAGPVSNPHELRPDEMRAQAAGDERLLVRSFPGRTRPAPAPPPPFRKQVVVVRAPTREETFAKACADRSDILAKAMHAFKAGSIDANQVIGIEIATNERLAALVDKLSS